MNTEAGKRLLVDYPYLPPHDILAIEAEAIATERVRVREGRAGLREELAALEHEQWAAWATTLAATERLSPDRLRRWAPLLVGYAELTEEMKDHDRKWADRSLAALLRIVNPEEDEK